MYLSYLVVFKLVSSVQYDGGPRKQVGGFWWFQVYCNCNPAVDFLTKFPKPSVKGL